MKKTVCGLAVLTALASTSVLAHQQGDILVKRAAHGVLMLAQALTTPISLMKNLMKRALPMGSVI